MRFSFAVVGWMVYDMRVGYLTMKGAGLNMEIIVREMNTSDEITIRTQFSDYCFRVIDPAHCIGLLSGGVLGNQQHSAVFVGEVSNAENGEPSESSRLEPGYRACFLCGGNGVRRLTTSMITAIELTLPGASGSDR